MSENEDRQETDPRMALSTGDPPIRRKKEDRLNRARFAEALAGRISSSRSATVLPWPRGSMQWIRGCWSMRWSGPGVRRGLPTGARRTSSRGSPEGDVFRDQQCRVRVPEVLEAGRLRQFRCCLMCASSRSSRTFVALLQYRHNTRSGSVEK